MLSTVLLGIATGYALPAGLASSPLNRSVRVYKRLRDPKRVALTFDDGPQARVTNLFLELLAAEDVRATFFVVGEYVRANSQLIREMHAAGHEIANHGFTHRGHFLRNPLAIADDIERGARAVEDVLSVRPTLYRPPHGIVTAATRFGAWRARNRLVLWSRWGKDWVRNATPGSIARNATRYMQGGDIVLLHDADQCGSEGSWRKTLAALPHILEHARKLDLQPSPIGGADYLTW